MTTNGEMQEETVEVNGITIYFVRIGKGPHVIFPQPGIVGTGRTDFLQLINLFDKEKYTIILWDPIGRGKSQFPDRRDFIFNNEFRDIEAKAAGDFMEKLGIKRYSLLGWCYSGQVALRLAAIRKDCVDKVIFWATHAYISEDICGKLERFAKRVISGEITTIEGEASIAKAKEANCGEEHFKYLNNAVVEGYWYTLRNNDGNVCMDVLPHVEADVLVLHGDGDDVCTLDQPTYIVGNLKKAKLHRIENGGHALHLRLPQEVHKIVDEFLQNSSPKSTN